MRFTAAENSVAAAKTPLMVSDPVSEPRNPAFNPLRHFRCRDKVQKMTRQVVAAFSGLALAAFIAVPAYAIPITNASFETPDQPLGAFSSFLRGSTSITGWTVIGPSPFTHVSLVDGSFTQGCCVFPAQDGTQWLDLTGNGSNVAEGVQQSGLATTAGIVYVLSFWVGNVSGGNFGPTSTVEVDINGAFGGLFTNTAVSNTLTWQQFSHSFTATGASTTIAFINRDGVNDDSNGLDNISLNVAGGPTPVPEPATLLLFGTGLVAGLVGLRKFRRLKVC